VATITQVASSATAVTILATNGARQGFKIVNTDTNRLYLLFDPNGTPTTSLYSDYLDPGDVYTDEGPNPYRDGIKGIWAAAGTGKANVTEW
jgi:hypothetical protein